MLLLDLETRGLTPDSLTWGTDLESKSRQEQAANVTPDGAQLKAGLLHPRRGQGIPLLHTSMLEACLGSPPWVQS